MNQRKKWMFFLALFALAALLTACAAGGGRPGSPADREPEPAAVKAIDKGHIIQKDGNRWLITAYADKNGTPYIDAYWFTVGEQTRLQNGAGQSVASEQLAVGAEVEAWYSGAVRESYPAQTDAAQIVLHDDPAVPDPGMIGRTSAVQAALRAQSGPSAAWAVKGAALDAENGYWNIELLRHETVEQPVAVRIDARSGQSVPVPVAENEAFRVFAPSPGSELGPGFTVEGEARVFEAAFSWTLEDGHHIMAEGHEMAAEGAPAWGRFRFDIGYEKASQPNMMLILYVHSAKDGSAEHELVIPLKVPEDRIKYNAD